MSLEVFVGFGRDCKSALRSFHLHDAQTIDIGTRNVQENPD
jgi:hypothetical protein